MPSSQTTGGRRLEALDGLRGIAAVAIVVLHVWMFDYGASGKPPKTFLDHLVGELRLGVPLFFVLSGYLLFRPYLGADRAPALGRYVIRRAARILPGYWLAIAVGFVLLRALDHARAIDVAELPIFLLFLQNYEPETLKQLNPPMWTLCVEVAFYAALPLIGLLSVRFARTRARQTLLCVALIAIGTAARALALEHDWPATATNSLPLFLPEFAAGMLAAVLTKDRRATTRTGAALIAAGVALVVADAGWHSYGIGPYGPRFVLGDTPAALGFALVVAGLVSAPLRARALTARPVHVSGELSYGIYLLHFLAIDLLRATDRWPENLAAAIAAVLGITVAGAAVSWYAVERPVLRYVRAKTATTRRRAPERGRARTQPAYASSQS